MERCYRYVEIWSYARPKVKHVADKLSLLRADIRCPLLTKRTLNLTSSDGSFN